MTKEEIDAFIQGVRNICDARGDIYEAAVTVQKEPRENMQGIFEGIAEAAETILEKLTEGFERIVEAIATCAEAAAQLICETVDVIAEAIVKARSREASRRRPEPHAEKPRPPIRKKLRVFRCRNSC